MAYIGSGPTRFNTADDLTVTDDATIQGELSVDGAVDLNTSLNVDGTVTADGLTVVTSSTGGFSIEDGTVKHSLAGANITAFQGTTNTNIRSLGVDAQNFVVRTGPPQGTSTTEAMRVDSSGVLNIGTTGLTNNGTRLNVSGTGNIIRSLTSGLSNTCFIFDKADNNTSTSNIFALFTINNQGIGSGQINANGASQAAFGSFSDRRLKENIIDLDSQWENIKALRPVEFDYIESEGGGHQVGFIAQEIETIYPDLVGERADGMLTLSGMGKNESRLIKALQEAIARIETLEAQVATLQGN